MDIVARNLSGKARRRRTDRRRIVGRIGCHNLQAVAIRYIAELIRLLESIALVAVPAPAAPVMSPVVPKLVGGLPGPVKLSSQELLCPVPE